MAVNERPIVAYTYRAGTHHPSCISSALDTSEGGDFDGWALCIGEEDVDPEDNLSEIALCFGINRDDETTFDSGYFPKRVYRGQLVQGEPCDFCSDPITDDDNEED